MTHLVVDIETLGVEKGSYITSISAKILGTNIGFDARNITYEGLSPTMDYNTVKWWLTKTDEDAKQALFVGEPIHIYDALDAFTKFCEENGVDKYWGNSFDFDMGHLEFWYKKQGKKVPWKFWELRDIRTIKSFLTAEEISAIESNTYKHNSVNDVVIECNILTKFAEKYNVEL